MEEKPDLRHRDLANGKLETTKAIGDIEEDKEEGTCTRLQDNCTRCCAPCLVRFNPLPEYPSLVQKLFHACRLPPHGSVAAYIQFAIVCLQIWVILYTLTHGQALPGGNFFSLLILFVCCVIGGYLISFIRLPPLLGMLIVGVLLRNIPGVSVIGENIDTTWSSVLKKVALTVILTRAGLGLDVMKLKKLSWAVLRLAFTPCLVEIITGGVVSRFLLGFPWTWSLMLGCILGALSPAVTVPSLVNLQERRYGVAKGIPTMLLAAGGLDNVLCITGFSVFLGIIFSEGDLAVTIIKGPLGAIAGVVYGFVVGFALWFIPAKNTANPVFYRSLMLFLAGMIAIFGSSEVGLAGAGPLGCLTTATVANFKWRQRRKPGETDEVSGVMGLAWLIVQHFLFGLIGSAVNISDIKSDTAGLGIATLGIGLVIRSIASFTVTMGTGFTLKERIFIVLTWLSKATVQAAIGGLALDRVRLSDNPDPEQLKLATDVLTIAVLAIIICAPTGATLMAVFGPKFLQKGEVDEDELEVVTYGEKPDDATEQDSKNNDSTNTNNDSSDRPFSDSFKADLSLTLFKRKDSDRVTLDNDDDVTTGIVNPCFVESEPVEYLVDTKDDIPEVKTDIDAATTTDIACTNAVNTEVNTNTDTTNTGSSAVTNIANNEISEDKTEHGTSFDISKRDTHSETKDDGTDVDAALTEIYKTVLEVKLPKPSVEQDLETITLDEVDDANNNNTI